jgi:nucleoside-diphosphate-sugar epimerase
MVNLLGAGFVGGRYAQLYPCMVNHRNDLTIKTNQVLYFISTVDNHNLRTNPYVDIETNLTTLIRVLEHSKSVADLHFNFVSSWFVYGNSSSAVTEQSPCNPEGFYSITKHTAERLLTTYCEAFGIKYRILRLANVLGPGDRKVSARKNALTYLIQQIKQSQDIKLQHGGHVYRDYIHVDDVCSAIDLIINQGELNSVWNIGNNVSTELKQAIDYVIKQTGSNSKIYDLVDENVRHCTGINCDKLFALGYRPKWSVTDILDQLIAND